MKACLRAFLTLGWLMFAVGFFGGDAHAQSPEALQRAEVKFARGSQSFEQGDYPEALRQMTAAFQEAPNYRTAAGLGQVELHLGQFRQAAEHLDFSLRNFPAVGENDARRQVMDGLAEARSRVLTLSVRCDVVGAEILINGRAVGPSPIEHDLYLSPGESTLKVKAKGYQTFSQQLYAPAGARKEVLVSLKQAAESPTSPSNMQPDAEHAWWVLGVGGGVALAAAGTSLGFWLDARTKNQRAERLSAKLGSNTPCGSDAPPGDCLKLLDLRRDSKSQADRATLLWTSAAATALVTTVVFAWLELDTSKTESAQDIAVTPSVGPTAAALSVGGRF